ncbi:hypothetical protein VOLCADRAFT_86216 [Volvox carteri f. nagariensis]|uniref:CFAP74 fourth Ig-like domain-containing protein n=1 Tax=Volvox carteri f. nagariensis TaxID=3068 RepID=D8TI72_VOLCA|nr:uncharacterized protein VOLCADRAFT_86216 [Volvox carteri f. nagariensis]EFJ53186.1 hypothetical protein VOLCADRAFT_86216 [Volvox carteri f. nagariensis]|eukprot:XP_002946191.1 hypothetical protein VOLCADRAFT_86216 [Volvox carteri f. nagariensis]
MALKAEELYLEELWKELDDDEDRPPPVLQQELADQHRENPLPSYHELMGSGAMAISLHRAKAAAASPPRTINRRPSSANGITTTTNNNNINSNGSGGGYGSPPAAPLAAWEEPPQLALGPTLGADPEQLKRQLQSVVQAVNANQKRYEEVLLEANKATDLVRSMEAEIGSLQHEAEELSRRLPPAPERQRQVQAWLAQRSASLEAQRGVQTSRQLELIAAEAALRAAERELDFLAEAQEEVAAVQVSENSAAAAATSLLRAREERAVAGYKRRQAAEAVRLAAAQQEAEAAAMRRLQAAEEAREKVLARMASERGKQREGQAANAQRLASEQGRRREAVMGLKNSLAAVRADVARQAELAAALQRQRRELQEKEFGALVEAGLNPYEVFRRRDQQEEAQRQHAAIQSNISARQLELAAQLAREQESYQERMAARKREKEDREVFDREMGVAARQARTDEYMRTHTATGSAMLDPTGRLPVFPSQVTVVKDARFGQGGAPSALLAQQMARLGPQAPKQLLLPAKYRSAEADAAAVAALGGTYSGGARHAAGDSDPDSEGMGSPPRSPRRASAPPPAAAATASVSPSRQQNLSQRHSLGGVPLQQQQQQQQGQGQGQGSQDRYKQLATRPLTKLEQSMMEAAKTRHKQAIGAAQTQMGRTFGGDAFLASPAVIEFKDYEMGRTTTLSVQIINRSYKKNTFRVLGIPVEYCDVLDFSYKLPGYLAPGVSGEVAVSFTPKTPVDVDTCLQLLADTGPFDVPIRCRTKRAELSVAPAAVDFGGGVTLGDSATRTFVLSNEGALEVEYRLDSPQLSEEERALLKSATFAHGTLKDATIAAAAAAAAAGGGGGGGGGGLLSRARSFASQTAATDGGPLAAAAAAVELPREERRLTHGGFTVFPCVGTLKGYSQVTFTVTFAPVLAAAAKLVINLSYKAPSVKRLSLPRHEVVVTAVGRDVPVYVERPVIDFQCCLLGHVYRDVLLAGDSFPITIRFKPTPVLLTACRRHLVEPEEDQILEIPMRLSVPDQTLPVPFSIRAQLTHTDLVFDPPSLDFGSCVMAERTALRLAITNPGRLPQTFGFVGLPSGLRVCPNGGFGHVLPGETLERLVSYQPPIVGPQSFTITARTLAGRTFRLPCVAVGVSPRLSLSHNVVAMPATAVGDTSTVSVVLANRTDSPQGGNTAGGESTGAVDADGGGEHGADVASGSAVSAQWRRLYGAAAASSWYRYREHTITCYIRPQQEPSQQQQQTPAATATAAAAAASTTQELHLQLSTCATLPDLVLHTPLPYVALHQCHCLDFGPVPVGQRVVRTLEVGNEGPAPMTLSAEPLDVREVFSCVNALRPVPPGTTFRMLVSFTPQARTQYLETLLVRSARSRLRLALRGAGIAPELQLGPEGPHAGMVAAYGHAEYRTLRLQCTLRGGLPTLSGGPDGRTVTLVARSAHPQAGGRDLSVQAVVSPTGGAGNVHVAVMVTACDLSVAR